TNPSARYEPDGAAGIINLVLKKQKGSGFSALANANGDYKGRFGGDALLSFRRGIVNVFGGGNFGRWGSDWTSNSESRTFGTTDTLYVAKTGHGDWAGLFRAGRAGFDLALGPHDKASMSGRVGAWDGGSGGNSDVTERHLPVDSVRQFLLGRSWENTRRFFFLTADHEHTFDTAGQKLTLSAYAVENNGRSESRNAEINSAGTDTTSGRRTAEPGPWKRANVELGYTLPAREKDRLEAGLQSRFEGMSQDYQLSNYDPIGDSWVLDTLSSHPYGGTQTIHSLYATYSWNWRALGVQPGLRGEYGDRVVEVTDTTTRWKVSRLDYFPSVHTTWSFESGQQMKASYSRRIDRPDPWYLRPFPVWFDARTVSVGYPELKPSYANSWELGCEIPFGGNSVSAEGYWRTTSDMVEWITTKEDSIVRKYTQDTTVLLQTARNVGRDRSIGVELTANVSPVKWFTAYLTGDVSDYHEEGRLFGQDFSSGIFYWTTSANLTFRLPTNTQVQLNGDFSGPSITATGRDDGWFGTNLAVKQTLLNRALSVTLRLSNLHGSRTQRSTSRGPGFKTQSEWRSEGLTASLAVSYNLNNFRFDPKMRAGEGVEQSGGGGGGGPQR
ncbi:TonB-dependent receptor, partial [candidate division WOR-3 bacterium]|nr:TonB-dependent receptor [candidate division WOR-3 bacterium]